MPAFLLVIALALALPLKVTAVESIPGEFIVKFKAKTELKDLKQSLSVGYAHFIDRNENFAFIKSNKSLRELSQLARSRDGRIEYIEPNYIYRVQAIPNDPEYKMLWGLKNSGQLIKDLKGT